MVDQQQLTSLAIAKKHSDISWQNAIGQAIRGLGVTDPVDTKRLLQITMKDLKKGRMTQKSRKTKKESTRQMPTQHPC